jgi:hypothetical protein
MPNITSKKSTKMQRIPLRTKSGPAILKRGDYNSKKRIPLRTKSGPAILKRELDKIKKNGSWMKIESWLLLAKLITVVGVIIFVISTATKSSGSVEGELAAYYWLAIGVTITLIMTTIMLARKSKYEHWYNLAIKMISLFIPTLATLTPIIVMIWIFTTVKSTLSKDSAHLPPQFYTFHYLTFFFLFLQLIVLYQFFGGEIKSILSNGAIVDTNKWAYVSAFIFFGIVTSGCSAELYVIITRFITDG